MSTHQKHLLLIVALVVVMIKFRTQIAGLVARVPVVGPFLTT